jgi:hypothetical protein
MSDNNELAAELAAGLRSVADMVEATPELASAFGIAFLKMQAYVGYAFEDKPAALATFARAALRHGAKVEKKADDKWSSVDAKWGPVTVSAYTNRDEVCERVVTGTEVVTKKVPDPEALALVPEVEVTEEVETFEWRCVPLLAAEAGES